MENFNGGKATAWGEREVVLFEFLFSFILVICSCFAWDSVQLLMLNLLRTQNKTMQDIYIWSILDESDSYVRMWEDIFYVFIWSQKINSIIGLHQLLLLIKVLNFHDHPMCWGVLSMWVKLCLDKSNWWLTRFVHILTIIDVVCLYIGWSWYFKTLIDT